MASHVRSSDFVRQDWRAHEFKSRTIGEYAEAYLARREIKDSTRALYESVWSNHLEKEWGVGLRWAARKRGADGSIDVTSTRLALRRMSHR